MRLRWLREFRDFRPRRIVGFGMPHHRRSLLMVELGIDVRIPGFKA